VAEVLRENPSWKVRVEGHTDNIGTDAYNVKLSTSRAAAVRQALVAQYRVGAARLTTAGYGATRPKTTNDTLEGRAFNRRVELVRTDQAK
jgi:outer membrane protein OmpA-like peptidoglycan-associated protein